ncbi:MAG: RNA 3'-terminal phosphate cyclase [Thiohalomonadaceae bacterium]
MNGGQWLTIDGAFGEGGGQILRSALALSLCLGRPFRIVNIRRARRRPGLRPQHLAAVKAATAVGEAEVSGAGIGSAELSFRPRALRTGEFHFSTGTAGSTTLVLQTVLPALLTGGAPSELVLEGGTHNPLAPPFDFFSEAFVPLLNRMGPHIEVRMERPGFYPAGGGVVRVHATPAARLQPLQLLERGKVLTMDARALTAHLPEHIALRELKVVGAALGLPADRLEAITADAPGPGNAVMVRVRSEHVTEVFTGFGERGVPAEKVASGVVRQVQRYLSAGVPVGEHLADQLLLPLALAGGGAFETLRPSLHLRTNAEVLHWFLGTEVTLQELGPDRWRVTVG